MDMEHLRRLAGLTDVHWSSGVGALALVRGQVSISAAGEERTAGMSPKVAVRRYLTCILKLNSEWLNCHYCRWWWLLGIWMRIFLRLNRCCREPCLHNPFDTLPPFPDDESNWSPLNRNKWYICWTSDCFIVFMARNGDKRKPSQP